MSINVFDELWKSLHRIVKFVYTIKVNLSYIVF